MNLSEHCFVVRNISIIVAMVALASCGGENHPAPVQTAQPPPAPGADPAPVPPPVVPDLPPTSPPNSTPTPTTLAASTAALTLSVNNVALNPALTGTPRSIVVTNTGSGAALDFTYSTMPALPTGASTTSTCAATLAVATSCTITFTPGATPTAAPGDLNPAPRVLTIAGSNTNTVTPSVEILTYGSVHQGGYAFAIDDTTAASGNISGKVAGLTDLAFIVPFSPTTGVTNAISLTDGASNTATVVAVYGQPTSTYAAGTCTAANAGFTDWYLPAPCEMGLDASCSVTMQNMQSALVDNPVAGGPLNLYWTSAEAVGSGGNLATQQFLSSGGGSFQLSAPKAFTEPVRCARVMTN